MESYQLPPYRDCLVKHAQRANYQAAIWRRCLEKDPKVPSPIGRGWKTVKIDWMDGQPAPACLVNGLMCTDMCKLKDCDNRPSDDDINQPDTDEDGKDEDYN